MTVQDVYTEICDVLLEPAPTGLTLGLVTQAQFLDMFADVFTDYLQRTGMIRKLIDMVTANGVSAYTEPDNIVDVQEAAYSERYIHQESGFSLDQQVYNWRTKTGVPRSWHEDRLGVHTIELNPAPNVAGFTVSTTSSLLGQISSTSAPNDFTIATSSALFGTIASFSGGIYLEVTGNMLGTISNLVSSSGNLTLLAAVKLLKKDWQLADLLELVPDTCSVYLKYGVLEKIFSMDGEQRDVLRARYCGARYLEGINLGKAIMEELDELEMQEVA